MRSLRLSASPLLVALFFCIWLLSFIGVYADGVELGGSSGFFVLPPQIIDSYFPDSDLYLIPDDPAYSQLLKRARTFEEMNEVQRAEHTYLLAYNRVKNTDKAPYLLFKQAALSETNQMSIVRLEEIIEGYPEFPLIDAVRYELCKRFFLSGDYEKAVPPLLDIVEHEEGGVLVFTPFAHTFLAVIADRKGDYAAVKLESNRSLECVARHGIYGKEQLALRNYLLIAKAMLADGEYDQITDLLKRVFGTAQSDLQKQEALLLLGDAFSATGERTPASEAYQQLLRTYPSSLLSLEAKEKAAEIGLDSRISSLSEITGIHDESLLRGEYRIGSDVKIPPPAERYFVQLGSFSDSRNADGLVRVLQDEGYSAFSQKAVVDGRTLYRVRIGGYSTREEAALLIEELVRRGHRGLIVRER
jgi:tetratricopeptide (TPR) repeat protein